MDDNCNLTHISSKWYFIEYIKFSFRKPEILHPTTSDYAPGGSTLGLFVWIVG